MYSYFFCHRYACFLILSWLHYLLIHKKFFRKVIYLSKFVLKYFKKDFIFSNFENVYPYNSKFEKPKYMLCKPCNEAHLSRFLF